MKEIENKVLEVNKRKLEQRLVELGAKKVYEKVYEEPIHSILYDFSERELDKSGKLLRLRKQKDKVFVTYKAKISNKNAKVMKELEVNIDDFNAMKEIFDGIGLSYQEVYIKKRISYKLGKVKFEFDKLPKIPWYMEIEAPNIKLIHSVCDKLGIEKRDLKPWTSAEVMRYYGK